MKQYIIFIAAVAFVTAESDNTLLSKANDDFTYNMTRELVKQHPGKSVVQSALLVLLPLGELGIATNGESHNEILRTIGLPNNEAIVTAFPILNKKLRSTKGVELKTGNRIYLAKNYELTDNFANLSRTVFDSEVKNIDFSNSDESAKDINDWVEEQTNHRIKNLVSSNSLDSYTRAVLVNTIYFKGTWLEQFDKEDTREAVFYVKPNHTITLPFMQKKSDVKYYSSQELNAQFVELSYVGNEASFVIGLPNEKDGLTKLLEALTPRRLNDVLSKMEEFEVRIKIPKFKIETTTNLKTSLKGIGIRSIFNPSKARLDNMVKNAKNLFISDATQKAFIEISEEGVEASAANGLPIRSLHTKPADDTALMLAALLHRNDVKDLCPRVSPDNLWQRVSVISAISVLACLAAKEYYQYTTNITEFVLLMKNFYFKDI